MVEATEGCCINQGKYANWVKSTKFETNFVDLRNSNRDSPKTKTSPKEMLEVRD
jgi:hypothetical protein